MPHARCTERGAAAAAVGRQRVRGANARCVPNALRRVLYQSRDRGSATATRSCPNPHGALPVVYLEHDPPQAHPTNTVHWADGPHAMLVHVTPFNALMWDAGRTPVRVVEHGVKPLADARWHGGLARGIVVVNNIDRRGRRLGLDVYHDPQLRVPLTLVGMGSQRCGGDGEVSNRALPLRVAAHRFFFNPIRYTSLGLAVIEARWSAHRWPPWRPLNGHRIRDGHNGAIDPVWTAWQTASQCCSAIRPRQGRSARPAGERPSSASTSTASLPTGARAGGWRVDQAGTGRRLSAILCLK